MKPFLAALMMIGLTLAGGANAATVLITGSNRGIGFEFVKQYAEKGWTVIATARNPDDAAELKDLAAKHKNIIIEKLDVLDEPGIAALAAKYKGKPIDVLINNAGILGDSQGQTLGTFSHATFDQVMSTHVYGALAVSQAFRDNVAASGLKKIIAITSNAGIISRPVLAGTGPGWAVDDLYFYRAAKVALNMSMKGLAYDLREKGVVVGLIHPGAVQTRQLLVRVGAERAANYLRPEVSVAGMIKVIDSLTQANSDHIFTYDGSTLPW